MRKDAGFSLIEALIGIFISSILFSIIFPGVSYFFRFYTSIKYDEQLSIIQRVSTNIASLISSTSIESDSIDLKGSENVGFKILNTKEVYLNNIRGRSISRYLLPFNTKGDTLYVESPFISSENPLVFSNNFCIYRFTIINNITKEFSLSYIPGLSQGSKTKPLIFGKEERVLTKIYDCYFIEEQGGVSMYFRLKNGTVFNLFFNRVGEL